MGKQVSSSSPAETVANIEELLTEILLRVPAGNLIRFKLVSKYWLSLISNPSFRNSHSKCLHNKTLYISTVEVHHPHARALSNRYHVQAIKASDLFSFSNTASKSKSKSNNVLRDVAFVDGDENSVPFPMGFGVFGSRIVLAGGMFSDPKFHYASKPSYVLDTSDSEPMFVSSVIPDMEQDNINDPFLQEIDGKLYLLSQDSFAEFDPKTKGWAPLELLPIQGHCFRCTVLGSKIFATLRDTWIDDNIVLCFDVASPHRSWTKLEPVLQFDGLSDYYPKVLVVDLEDDDFEKLMFTYTAEKILVHHTQLSSEGEPCKIRVAASVDLPELPCLSAFEVISHCCSHLGDRKVCFSFMLRNWKTVDASVLVLTLEYARSKSPDVSSSSTSDPSGSFSAKTLGYHLFDYNREVRSSWIRLGGCFVL